MLTRRLKVKEYLYLSNAEAFFSNHRPSFMYLSGFSGSTAALIITQNKDYLVVDGRYVLRAKEETDKDIEIVDTLDKSSILKKVTQILNDLGIKRIAVEYNNLKVSDFLFLSEFFRVDGVSYLVETIRSEKDEEELENITKALRIAEKVMEEVESKLYEGVGKITEIELANFIKNRVVEMGADGVAFEPIVAFGPNTAYPHYSPRNCTLRENDFVIIDMGAVYKSYHSDITRSFCIGRNPEFDKLYNIVLEAQLKAIESIRSNIDPKQPYKTTVEIFSKYGMEQYFTHGLGHGVGLEIHELPSLSSGGFGYLKNYNVITVEPGLYIPNLGGIRIEDMVIIKDGQAQVITNYKK
ncbi:MAG: Xaa-Pro peptidase family protein [bacterium]